MSLIELQAWLPSSDLSGAPDHTFSTDDQLVDAGFNPVLWGEGDGFLEIHADDPDAQYLQRRGFIRAVRTDTNEGLFWWILEEGSVKLLSLKGKVEKVIRWDGRGMLYYLDRYRLGQAVWAPGQPNRGSVSVIDYWTWIDQPMIAILTRFMEEGQYDTRADFLDKLEYDFSRTQDSNGNSLTAVDQYQVRIGTGGLTLAADAMRQGNLLQVLPDTPPTLQAFRSLSEYRTDRSSGTFAANKVRFAAGVNIATELPHKIVALRERTHTLTRRQDGQYATEALNGTGEPYMDFLEVPSTSDPDVVEAIVGQSHLNREKQSTVAVIRHIIGPGGASGADGYFPSPAGDYWLGDLVTVHVGSDEYDLNEQSLEVAGIRYFLRGADWMVEAQLGAQVINSAGAPVNVPTAGPTVPQGPRIELCQADVDAVVEDLPLIQWDWEAADEDTPEWLTINQPALTPAVERTFDAFVGEYYGFFDNTGSGSSMPRGTTNGALVPVTPGTTIQINWRSRKGSTGFAALGIAWLTGDFDDWDATGRASFIDSQEVLHTWTQGSAFQTHSVSVEVPVGVTAMYLDSNGGGTTSTWYVHDLEVLLLGVSSGVAFDGDGPVELVGTSVRASRCDHNHLVETLLTEETNTALVLHPDGAGGIEWGTDATGGGGSGAMHVIAETLVAGSAAATIDFTSIPGTYRHLILVIQGRSSASADAAIMNMTFNNDTGSNYDWHRSTLSNVTLAHAASAGTTSLRAGVMTAANAAASNNPGQSVVHIAHYAGTVFNKTYHAHSTEFQTTAATGFVSEEARGVWRSMAAITRITLTPSTGSWIVGSIATLYGTDTA